jgi:L-ascorbate metabolism protein UlaG (beta-lactamase superfamily)
LARFPVSGHCDGERFFNPGPSPASARGLRQVLKWRLEGNRARWPDWVVNTSFPPPPADVATGSAAVTFIGHASFLLRLNGLSILTDPVFSDRCSPVSWAGPRRVRAPGLALDVLPRIDLILLSHNHYDHMDLPSLRRLHARDAPPVITTLGNAQTLAGLGLVRELDWWDTANHRGLRVTATPARHFARRGMTDMNRSLWAGFMVRGPDGAVLFCGDSGAGPHWADIGARLGPPGLALIPIGAYEPRWMMAPVHMNPAEAVQAHLDLGAKRSIGMHFGTFQLTDEAMEAPVKGLEVSAAEHNLGGAFGTLGFGETAIVAL